MELVITSFFVLQLYNSCPESNISFFSKNLFLDHEKLYIIKSDFWLHTFFHKVSIHFYSLVQIKNNCVYTL